MHHSFKLLLTVMAATNSLLISILFSVWHYLPNDQLGLWFLNIGQGDASLIRAPLGSTVLIDGGPDSTILAELGKTLPFFQRDIDLVVITHPDLDHIGGLVDVLRRYDVHAVLMSDFVHSSETYKALLHEIQSQDIPLLFAEAHYDFMLDNEVYMDVLYPLSRAQAHTADSPNNASIVTRLSFGDISVLYTGDAEEPVEAELVAMNANLAAHILKVGHHGSNTSSSMPFLAQIKPELAVISAGIDNKYHHPHPDIMNRLATAGIQTHVTASDGRLQILCTHTICMTVP